MLGWLRRRRENAKARERRIFLLRTPHGTRWIDPLPAAQRLEDKLGPDWTNLAAKLFRPEPVAPAGMPPESITNVAKADRQAKEEAVRRLSEAACEALGIEPIASDGSGMTQAERVAAVVQFVVFLIDLGETARPFPHSPSPTG